ncbi:MAG: flavin-containing monooxygenase [Pseudomonadota bacterium]
MSTTARTAQSTQLVPRERAVLDVKGSETTHEVRYLIIGAGLSGLGMAMQLKATGRRDFLVLEKESEPGGYWRQSGWPGSASETPSQLSAFSFAPFNDWVHRFPTREDMLAYIDHLVSRYGLAPCIEFNVEVISLRYLTELERWQVELRDGRYLRAEFIMMGTGALGGPERPDISGLDDFSGASLHASEWDPALDLTGRHVAVIGTGESAVQIVPHVTEKAASVTLFQEEPMWILPQANRTISAAEKALTGGTPWLLQRQRQRIFKRQEAQFSTMVPGSRPHQQAQKRARNHIKRSVPNMQKRRQLTPGYPIGSRPIRYADDFYKAVNRKHVRIVDAGVREVTEHHVIGEDGSRCEADTLIFATPWRWPDALVPPGMIIGPGGSDLGRRWQANGIESYRGLCVPGMPNLFMLNGPHTALRHNSPTLMLEAQYGAIMDCLSHMEQQGLKQLEPRPEAAADFARDMRQASVQRVWGSTWQGSLPSHRRRGSESVQLWPHDVQAYQTLMRAFDRDAFIWR